MEKILTYKQELELAKAYAESGPNDVPKEYMEKCIKKAITKAKKLNINISKEIKKIRKIWNNQ